MLFYIVQIADDSRHVVVWSHVYYSLEYAKCVGAALARFLFDVPSAAVELLSFDTYGKLADIDVLGWNNGKVRLCFSHVS